MVDKNTNYYKSFRMTVNELKKISASMNLPVSGNKTKLIENSIDMIDEESSFDWTVVPKIEVIS